MGTLRLYLKVKHDVQNDSELPLAKAELESLLGAEVVEVVNPVDLFIDGPFRPLYTSEPPRLQDWMTWHAYPGSVQGFYAEVEGQRDLSNLLRIAYFREFYITARSDEVPVDAVHKLMPGILEKPEVGGPSEQELAPFARLFILDGHWVLRAVPLQTMYEFSDFVCRLANSPDDVERMFKAGIEHLQRGIYRPYYAESARLFKTIEDFMDDRRAPQLYLTHWFLGIHGKFFPRMIRAAMNAIGLREGDLVLDPFTGCGTLNVEASLMGIRSVGVEINPLLAAVSRIKVRALGFDVEETRRRIQRLESIIKASLGGESGSRKQRTLLDEEDVVLADPTKVSVYLPDKIRSKVKRDSLDTVRTILAAIEEFEDPDFRDFCKVPLMYWMRSMLTKQDPDKIVKTYLDHLWRMYFALHFLKLFRERVARIEPAPAKILVGDSTELRRVLEGGASEELAEGFDGVVTSPPYMTAIDYVGDQLYALYALGFTKDHLEIDKRTLGSTKAVEDLSLQITRGGAAFSELPASIREFLTAVYRHRRKHASALLKYFHGILRSFRELREVVKPGGKVVWIIGKQQVMKLNEDKVTVPVAKMMEELGETAGLKHQRTIHVELAKSSERGAIPTESLIFFESP